jgi:orotidine-5'-phosphate decarboxylase
VNPAAARVIVALDFSSSLEAAGLVQRLDPAQCALKIGKELFTAAGPAIVEQVARAGFRVFLDLKYHDIPNTVAAACRSAAALGVWMLNVHALGGRAMLQAARAALPSDGPRPLVIAVTVLTSMNAADLREVGIDAEPEAAVLRLAALAEACGLDGVVCSAREAASLRSRLAAPFALVTPGIRPGGSGADDQQRVTTPAQAIALGADYLVVGRPVTRAADPLAALAAINAEVSQALAARKAPG